MQSERNCEVLCYCGVKLKSTKCDTSSANCQSCYRKGQKDSSLFLCNNNDCCYKQVMTLKYWICSVCAEFEKNNEEKSDDGKEKELYCFNKRINTSLNLFSYFIFCTTVHFSDNNKYI